MHRLAFGTTGSILMNKLNWAAAVLGVGWSGLSPEGAVAVKGGRKRLWIPSEAACSFNSYYSFWRVWMAATLSDWAKVLKLGRSVRHLLKSHWPEYYLDWPDGGAIGTVQSCKLWKAISQAPYVVQTWNFAQMCLSSQWTNLPQEPISSAYLDFPPFWILWKTPKSLLLLQKWTNLHALWYT